MAARILIVEDNPDLLAILEQVLDADFEVRTALSGEAAILPALRRLAVKRILPAEVRSAVMEAIYQLSTQVRVAAVEE